MKNYCLVPILPSKKGYWLKISLTHASVTEPRLTYQPAGARDLEQLRQTEPEQYARDLERMLKASK